MKDFTPIDRCVVCGSEEIKVYADFGKQALANGFREPGAPEDKFPLGLQVCLRCSHSMQLGVVDPERLYRDYPYASGTSDTLKQYFADLACRVHKQLRGDSDVPLRVLEIASNDGSLLRCFRDLGHYALGVDPAENLADLQQANRINTIRAFWNTDTLNKLPTQFKTVDVIVAMNVLGHVADPAHFLILCKGALAHGGRIYIQTSQAHMLERAEFDTVYHEHISFFVARSFLALARKVGLVVDRISYVPVHGTSYLVELVVGGEQKDEALFEIAVKEKGHGCYNEILAKHFREKVYQVVDHARSTIDLARREGYRIAGYGAAAKGMTFINVAGIRLDFIVDDSPLKIGKVCPGSETPVVSPDDPVVQHDGPIFWFLLAWNFADEIKDRIKRARPDKGDRFMVAYPQLTVTTE